MRVWECKTHCRLLFLTPTGILPSKEFYQGYTKVPSKIKPSPRASIIIREINLQFWIRTTLDTPIVIDIHFIPPHTEKIRSIPTS